MPFSGFRSVISEQEPHADLDGLLGTVGLGRLVGPDRSDSRLAQARGVAEGSGRPRALSRFVHAGTWSGAPRASARMGEAALCVPRIGGLGAGRSKYPALAD